MGPLPRASKTAAPQAVGGRRQHAVASLRYRSEKTILHGQKLCAPRLETLQDLVILSAVRRYGLGGAGVEYGNPHDIKTGRV